MKYLEHYSITLQNQIKQLFEENRLDKYLLSKYKSSHNINADKSLYNYTLDIKNRYLKKQQISKVVFDSKINVINNALGMHSFISRVQGNKLKSKNELKISSIFKNAPIEFLEMIVVHELAHFKEKEHNKAFYNLCTYMCPNYHQYEFDLRVYLFYMEKKGKLF